MWVVDHSGLEQGQWRPGVLTRMRISALTGAAHLCLRAMVRSRLQRTRSSTHRRGGANRARWLRRDFGRGGAHHRDGQAVRDRAGGSATWLP